MNHSILYENYIVIVFFYNLDRSILDHTGTKYFLDCEGK